MKSLFPSLFYFYLLFDYSKRWKWARVHATGFQSRWKWNFQRKQASNRVENGISNGNRTSNGVENGISSGNGTSNHVGNGISTGNGLPTAWEVEFPAEMPFPTFLRPLSRRPITHNATCQLGSSAEFVWPGWKYPSKSSAPAVHTCRQTPTQTASRYRPADRYPEYPAPKGSAG